MTNLNIVTEMLDEQFLEFANHTDWGCAHAPPYRTSFLP